MVEVVLVESPREAGKLVARSIIDLVAAKPDAVLGFATGTTPLVIYNELAAAVERGECDLSRVRGFALDEYVGLSEAHPESYHSVIERDVIGPLGLDPNLVHVPNGALDSIQHAGQDFEDAIIAAGGIDLQILGIGTVGHLGFNEPGSSLSSLTRVKTLTHQTRQDNARFFGTIDEVPMHSITQGLGTILRSEHAVMLAFGESKAKAVQRAVEGGVSASLPASILQLHRHATVLVDAEAASRLENLTYYQRAWEQKMVWQRL